MYVMMDRLSQLWFDELMKGNFDMSEEILDDNWANVFELFRLSLIRMVKAIRKAIELISSCFETIAAEKIKIDSDERKIIVERGKKTKNLPNKIRENSSRPVAPKINRKLERGRNG